MNMSDQSSPARSRITFLHQRGRGYQGKCSCGGKSGLQVSPRWLHVGCPALCLRSRWGIRAKDREHLPISNQMGMSRGLRTPDRGFVVLFHVSFRKEKASRAQGGTDM